MGNSLFFDSITESPFVFLMLLISEKYVIRSNTFWSVLCKQYYMYMNEIDLETLQRRHMIQYLGSFLATKQFQT